MLTSKKQWFYLNLGQRRGPVTKDKLCELIERKEIYYTDVQVWKEGMKEWLPITKVRSFAPSIKKVETPNKGHVDKGEAKEIELKEEDSYIDGLSRVGYNLYFYLGWPIVYFIGLIGAKELQVYGVLDSSDPRQAEWATYVPWGLVALVTLLLTSSRMRNAGYAGTWSMGLLVPILNLWVLLVSLCGPKNYRRRKRLGMSGLCFFLFLVGVSAATVFVNAGDHHINLKGMREKAMGFYVDKSKLESRSNRHLDERAKHEMEDEEEKREHQKTGREGRGKTERELELEEASDGLIK